MRNKMVRQQPNRSRCTPFQLLVVLAVLWIQLNFVNGGEQDDATRKNLSREMQGDVTQENWSISVATIVDNLNYEFTVTHAIGIESNSVEVVTLYEYDCTTPLDSTAIVTSDPSNNVKTDDTFSFVVELDDSFYDSGSTLVELDAPVSGRITGTVKFCSNVERQLPGALLSQVEPLTITYRRSKYIMSFIVFDNTFTLNPEIQADEPDIVTEIISLDASTEVCFCSLGSFNCISSTSTDIELNQIFYICFTPSSEEYDISNLNILLSSPDDGTQYEAVQSGESGPVDGPLASSFSGFQTGKTWETLKKGILMPSQFFDTGFDQVLISGSVLLGIADNSRIFASNTTNSTFSLGLNLLRSEEDNIEDFLSQVVESVSAFFAFIFFC